MFEICFTGEIIMLKVFQRYKNKNLHSNGDLNLKNRQSPTAKMSKHSRLVQKNGDCNITNVNIRKKKRHYLVDIFTTMVDIKWRWNILIFTSTFIISWIFFAFIWWVISYIRGDLNNEGNTDHVPCVNGIEDFVTALLFSIETQHTIGYGGRMTTSRCPEAIVVMMIQSCFGVICDAIMAGLVFAKIARPKRRAETLMFSKHAVVCKRDNELCLLFRVGDMRKSHFIEVYCRAILVKKRVTLEGEIIPLAQHDIQISGEDGSEKLFLAWPLILEHKITESSPFWSMSADDFSNSSFEVIVILEGIVESTGMTTQVRTSYLPSEILWGHRFQRFVTFQNENGDFTMDYSQFDTTVEVNCSRKSSKEQSEGTREQKAVICNCDSELEEDTVISRRL